ncbi:hypothetical protein [Geobacillus thermoleovorans]|uniref:hypothetical protein n=1 Tax=Geobacillus thermoleovorans TaxID=33941 RepID=UPI0012E9B59D|nr:hypothetical protein [Geobacillus thermoleovorans]
MSLDERSTAILQELVRRDGYLSVKELIKKFNTHISHPNKVKTKDFLFSFSE